MVVGVYDVLNAALKPCMDTYSFIEGYIAAAIIFWGINALVKDFSSLAEKSLTFKK